MGITKGTSATEIMEARSKSHVIIRRMIESGYSDDAITLRLRHSIEIVQQVRQEIELEKSYKHQESTDYSDDEGWE